ncbi:cytochrome P450 3A24-like [Lytechinus variegatus]|uniref:cytochrome P450 3A24-like n=1 Tax=Lytechinus variegatus TaxID=7654 RepID=UPI001BB23B43|nr:cytochrome P450 3A24-like [Lytechinus variegatus]
MGVNVFGFDISLTWLLVGAAVIIYICHDLWIRSYWKRHGIKSPPSIPIFGNTLQWTKGIHNAFLDYNKKLGSVYGIYDCHRASLCVSDPDLLKELLIKSFSSFTNRWIIPLTGKALKKALFNVFDDQWRQIRNVVTPTFSAAKMKHMFPLVNDCASTLLKNIEKHQKKSGDIDCNELLGAFAMDNIASCAFGLKVESQENRNDPFVANAKYTFANNFFSSQLVLLSTLFPWVVPILEYFNITVIKSQTTEFYADIVKKAIATRNESDKAGAGSSNGKRIDFLQLLIDAHEGTASNDKNKVENGVNGYLHDGSLGQNGLAPKSSKKSLNDKEVIGQAVTFFVAGYETTSSASAYVLYFLATHPDVQDRLIEEIDDVAPFAEDLSYQSISKMSYLDQIINETLRVYPIAPLIDRVCNEPFTVDGFTIPKGMRIFIPVFSIHHDPTLWPDPETFDPERFSKENRQKHHPCAWMPFGLGPRNCIGMRFAMMEIKVVTVRILQKYLIKTCPQTEIPPKIGNRGLISPTNGIVLRAARRI